MIGTLIALAMVQTATPAASADDNKMKCKTSPVLGSRTKFKRDCRTLAEWRVFEKDKEQLRRDLGNAYRQKIDE